MKIGILTSSRSDFGIYQPLLNRLKEDDFFDIEIIAFGTHTSKYHGFTITEIEEAGFSKIHKISSLLTNDDPQSIVSAYGLTLIKFADFWTTQQYDLVFCLGDRFEMSAAVQASIPFGVKLAHIHGGETTLGAIDNIYRHQITLASNIHFTATDKNSQKVKTLTGDKKNVFSVGALSLDEVNSLQLLDEKKFRTKFEIPHGNFALITFHPETVAQYKNHKYAKEMTKAVEGLIEKLNLVITMPNADTLGSLYRSELYKLKDNFDKSIILVENFGKVNYFSAMKYAKFLVGNTSSGIIEAASFGKYVVNVGDRQKGREQSKNIINCPFSGKEIFNSTLKIIEYGDYKGMNIYYKSNVAKTIIEIIKNIAYKK